MANRFGRDRPGAPSRGDVRLRTGDAEYGTAAVRAGLAERGLTYAVGILSTQHVYPTDVSLEPPPRRTRGRPATNPVPSVESRSAADFIAALPEKTFQRVSWRAGTKGAMRGDFAAVRVRVADGPALRTGRHLPGAEVWLVCERRSNERKPGGGLAVHHRRRQGPVQGDPPDLWQGHADPALSGAQGAQHHRTAAQIAARLGAQDPAAGLGTGRCRQGRAAGPEPGTAAGEGLARHLGHHPGGAGRNPVRGPARPAPGSAA